MMYIVSSSALFHFHVARVNYLLVVSGVASRAILSLYASIFLMCCKRMMVFVIRL